MEFVPVSERVSTSERSLELQDRIIGKSEINWGCTWFGLSLDDHHIDNQVVVYGQGFLHLAGIDVPEFDFTVFGARNNRIWPEHGSTQTANNGVILYDSLNTDCLDNSSLHYFNPLPDPWQYSTRTSYYRIHMLSAYSSPNSAALKSPKICYLAG